MDVVLGGDVAQKLVERVVVLPERELREDAGQRPAVRVRLAASVEP